MFFVNIFFVISFLCNISLNSSNVFIFKLFICRSFISNCLFQIISKQEKNFKLFIRSLYSLLKSIKSSTEKEFFIISSTEVQFLSSEKIISLFQIVIELIFFDCIISPHSFSISNISSMVFPQKLIL